MTAVERLRGQGDLARRLLAYALVSLLPLVALTAWQIQHARDEASERAQAVVARQAGDIALRVDAVLQSAQRVLRFLATRPEVRGADDAACRRLMEEWLALQPELAGLGAYRQGEDARCAARVQLPPHVLDLGPHAQAASGLQLGPVWRLPADQRRVAPLTLAVPGAPGLRLVALLDVGRLAEEWAAQGLPAGSMVSLTDAEDRVMAHHPNHEHWVGSSVRDRKRRFLAAQPDGLGEVTGADGLARIVAYAPVTAPGGTVAVGLPADFVEAQAWADTRHVVLLLVAGTLATVLLAAVLSHRLSRPWERLVQALAVRRDGRQPVLLPEDGPADAALLAREFNHLAAAQGRLRERLDLLGRVHATLVQVDRAVMHGLSREALERLVCEACIADGDTPLASVWRRQGTAWRLQATAGPRARIFEDGELVWSFDEGDASLSPCALAVRHGVAVLGSQPGGEAPDWVSRARAAGLARQAAVPLRRSGAVDGLLLLHLDDHQPFDAERVRLLEDLARDVSFGIDHLDREAERLTAQREARRAQARLARLFRATPVMLLVAEHPTGVVQEVNDLFLSAMGLRRVDVIGRRLQELPAGPRAHDLEGLRAALAAGPVHERPIGCLRADGQPLAVTAHAELIEQEGGPVLMLALQDVSQARRQERELQQVNGLLRLLQGTGQVWGWSPRAGVAPWPDAFTDATGWTAQTLGPQPALWLSEVLAEDRERVVSAVREALLGRTPLDLHLRVLGVKGTPVALRVRAVGEWDDADRLVRVAGTVQADLRPDAGPPGLGADGAATAPAVVPAPTAAGPAQHWVAVVGGPQAPSSLALVTDLLRHRPQVRVRRLSAAELGGIDPAAPPALVVLDQGDAAADLVLLATLRADPARGAWPVILVQDAHPDPAAAARPTGGAVADGTWLRPLHADDVAWDLAAHLDAVAEGA